MVSLASVADPKIFKGGGIKFISLAHNQLDAVYTGKADLLKKIGANRGGGRPHRPPESYADWHTQLGEG